MDRQTAPSGDLSDRELSVVRGIVEGSTYRQIADRLGIGVETVRTHAASIRRKLQMTKSGIAAWAVRNGKV
jgi:DNA-binding CsgD family transcriptional regulator